MNLSTFMRMNLSFLPYLGLIFSTLTTMTLKDLNSGVSKVSPTNIIGKPNGIGRMNKTIPKITIMKPKKGRMVLSIYGVE